MWLEWRGVNATGWTGRDSNLYNTKRLPRDPPSLLFSGFVPRIKRLGLEAQQSPPDAEAKNGWCYTFASLLCLHGVNREHFTFTFL